MTGPGEQRRINAREPSQWKIPVRTGDPFAQPFPQDDGPRRNGSHGSRSSMIVIAGAVVTIIGGLLLVVSALGG